MSRQTSELDGHIARATGIDGLIATNTTLSRDGLTSSLGDQRGGLSGAPLFERSTRVLARFSAVLGPDIPIIGVGGIGSPETDESADQSTSPASIMTAP